MKQIITITLITFFSFNLNAINVKNMPRTIVQPDGTKIECFITGDEFGGMIHDAEGYAIKYDKKTGWWYYAVEKDGKVVCSEYIVGEIRPKEKGLKKGLFEFNEVFYESVNEQIKNNKRKFQVSGGILKSTSSVVTINTLVIFVRFNGAAGFYENHSYFEPFFNSTTQESLKDYIQEVSYNKMNVNSTFYPYCSSDCNSSVEDAYTRDYYINSEYEPNGYDGEYEKKSRKEGLIKRAVEAIASNVPTSINLDADNDGKVDHVCIIVQGGSANIYHGDLLWPHKSALTWQSAYINNKQVYDYTFLNTDVSWDKETICHEFLHVVGMPDTYHKSTYKPTIQPTGSWDIMGDRNGNFPHPGAYLKYDYAGWINSIPEITINDRYTLNPITTSSGNCYKIKSPYNCNEYFVVEYRRRTGDYENTLPGDGLLVYRINPNGDTYNGPNDEVYIYRPNGTLTVNGTVAYSNFSSQSGRTSINDGTNPNSFLCDGSSGGLRIYNIGNASTGISFDFEYPYTITSASNIVCSGGTVFTANNLPGGYTISWMTSSNLEIVDGGSTETATIKQKSTSINGKGWVQVNLTSGGCTTAACRKEVWVGAPIIEEITGPMYTPNGQWATYHAVLESELSSPTDYNWILNPLNGNSVYDYGDDVEIAFYNSGSYQLLVQAKNTCSAPDFGPYYGTSLYVYDSKSLSVSPNPSSGEVIITIESTDEKELLTEEWDLEIYNNNQTLKEKKTKLKGNEYHLNTSGWKDGVYMLRVNYKNEILTGKLVVKR